MRRTIAAIAAVLAITAGAAGCSKSQDEIVADCTKALDHRAEGDKTKPEACNDLSKDDYSTVLMGWVLKKEGLDNVDESPGDLLDYSDDGKVNGSK
jgi:hypothetical protein